MNILIDTLPEKVEIAGKSLRIRTDFRIWIEFEKIMHNSDVLPKDKFMMISRLCFEESPMRLSEFLPEDVMNALCEFYSLSKGSKKKNEGRQDAQVFSFSEDGDYIFAAFLGQYGIDLMSVPYMHWFVFSALLKGLDDNCRLMKIMSWRAVQPEQEKNPERRKYLWKMKELYALPDMRTSDEKDRDIAEALSGLL